MLEGNITYIILMQQAKRQMINQQVLAQITSSLLHQELYEQSWPALRQKYLISDKIQSLREIHNIAKKLNQKQLKRPSPQGTVGRRNRMEVWSFGELKIFETVCILYSLLHSVELQLFAEADYSYLKMIFLQRSESFLKYEVASLQKSKVRNNTEWRKNQVQIFVGLVEQDQILFERPLQKLQWKYYSYQLFNLSKGRYYRTLQQCREKWTNYLNPRLSHAPWSIHEDILLFELIKELGSKWSAISKKFGKQRTEHMVKNRFNSYIKSWKNKCFKGVPHQEVATKILELLNGKTNKSENLEKTEIRELLGLQNGVKKCHKQGKSPQQKPEGEMLQPQRNGQLVEETVYSFNLPAEPKNAALFADEYSGGQVLEQLKPTTHGWDRHLEIQQCKKRLGGVECQKTWDNELEAPETGHVQHQINSRPEVVLQLQRLRKPFTFQRYCPKDLIEGKVYLFDRQELHQRDKEDDSLMHELQQKDILSWLDWVD